MNNFIPTLTEFKRRLTSEPYYQGVIASLFWLVYIFALTCISLPADPLTLNELGDYLAGAFAPLGLLWIVLGFRQQGEAINAQMEEIKNSIEEQRDLAQATRMQAELATKEYKEKKEAEERSRKMQLAFLSSHRMSDSPHDSFSVVKIHFQNIGKIASAVQYRSMKPKVELINGDAPPSLLRPDVEFSIPIRILNDGNFETEIEITYIDGFGVKSIGYIVLRIQKMSVLFATYYEEL